jgi:HD superfamily phosphohydrolase
VLECQLSILGGSLAEDPHRIYEIRCPVHGFVPFNDWEREIISQPAFQRLRRIRQLAWTDLIYPGAMHTRFEHSLGVMHTATLLYDSVVQKSRAVLVEQRAYTDDGLQRDRQLVRLAALLHDVGHPPFSHSAEDLFPEQDGGSKRFAHEDYSAAIIRGELRGAIEDHSLNQNTELTADKIASLIEGSTAAKRSLFWRGLISGHLDADRMDYLLRDSHHIGVHYGRFDFRRLISSVVAIRGEGAESPRLGIEEGGWHAAEALVLARYFMFTQVYFHKTRVAYDWHMREALKVMLPGGHFPKPVGAELKEFLQWDDWRVLGLLASGEGGEDGKRIAERNHYREIYHTPEVCDEKDLSDLEAVKVKLGDLLRAEVPATKSWYKPSERDIPVYSRVRAPHVQPLSKYSKVIAGMKENNQFLLYVDAAAKEEALKRTA